MWLVVGALKGCFLRKCISLGGLGVCLLRKALIGQISNLLVFNCEFKIELELLKGLRAD